MSYINKDATLAAIANKAKEELADANHYFLEGVQLSVDVVEGMPEPKDAENGSMPCPDARNSHDRTTDDCISRQAAIDALDKRFDSIPMEQTTEILQLRKDLRELPSAQPERMRGKWINGTCNQCGSHAPYWAMATTYYESNFCPNCGAEMEENE